MKFERIGEELLIARICLIDSSSKQLFLHKSVVAVVQFVARTLFSLRD